MNSEPTQWIRRHETVSQMGIRIVAGAAVVATAVSMKNGHSVNTPTLLVLTGVLVMSMYLIDGVVDDGQQ